MVDTDQEKEALSISVQNLETIVWMKKEKEKEKKDKTKKKRGKKKMENELVLHELTKAVLNAAFYKIECHASFGVL